VGEADGADQIEDNTLSGIACASATSCQAVGYYANGMSGPQPESHVTQTLALRYTAG